MQWDVNVPQSTGRIGWALLNDGRRALLGSSADPRRSFHPTCRHVDFRRALRGDERRDTPSATLGTTRGYARWLLLGPVCSLLAIGSCGETGSPAPPGTSDAGAGWRE